MKALRIQMSKLPEDSDYQNNHQSTQGMLVSSDLSWTMSRGKVSARPGGQPSLAAYMHALYQLINYTMFHRHGTFHSSSTHVIFLFYSTTVEDS